MLDSKTLRKETTKVSLSLKKRGYDFDLDSYLKMDQKMRDLISAVEEPRSSKNNINKSTASLDTSENDKSDLIYEVGTINKKIKESEQSLNELSEQTKRMGLEIPNILDESVPEGSSEEENIEIRSWGKLPKFDFEPKDHSELGESNGGIDFESAAANYRVQDSLL
jgi:Seryl-tRNA synthetase